MTAYPSIDEVLTIHRILMASLGDRTAFGTEGRWNQHLRDPGLDTTAT